MRAIFPFAICLFTALLLPGTAAVAQLAPVSGKNSDALLHAVRTGAGDSVPPLLDGADSNLAEADGTTLLHYAVRNDDQHLVETLLHAGADIHARNRYGVTAIYLAAQNGNASMMATLLQAGANPNEFYREGERVLMTAARTGNYDTVKLLLDRGADVNARENWHGQTALMWAVAQHHASLVPLLVGYGADVNALSNVEEWERQVTDEPREKWLPPGGMSPLLFAAREGCLTCISPLLQAGADIDAATPKGLTSLLISIINGHYDVAWELLQAGADVNLSDDTNRSPLYAAVDFNTMPESNRPSPSVIDNEHSSLELIEALLEHGADVNVQLSKQAPYRLKLDRGNDTMLVAGTTPFLRAAKDADIPAMTLLLRYGADATLGTLQGINPLMTAANLGTKEADTTGRYKTQEQIIKALQICLDQGLDIDAQANDGRTAVFGAAMFGFDRVVQFLHDQGAKLDYQDQRGLAPLDAAMGKAGGYGFVGTDGVYHEATVALIQDLLMR
ncbi:MAG: ankyrin repeat domain-containing protein [Pseudomonadales bacterium]|nr:ankyrin repeat domain-containing protein [Pseudomonadales bacterium]